VYPLYNVVVANIKIIWSREINVSSDELVKLTLIGKDKELFMYVNDKLINDDTKVDLMKGNTGVFAYSKGCFVLDDFNLFQAIK